MLSSVARQVSHGGPSQEGGRGSSLPNRMNNFPPVTSSVGTSPAPLRTGGQGRNGSWPFNIPLGVPEQATSVAAFNLHCSFAF